MRSGDELLRVGPFAFLEARTERIGALEHSVADGDAARAILQLATPLRTTVPGCHAGSSMSCPYPAQERTTGLSAEPPRVVGLGSPRRQLGSTSQGNLRRPSAS